MTVEEEIELIKKNQPSNTPTPTNTPTNTPTKAVEEKIELIKQPPQP